MLGRALILSIAGFMALATACGGSDDDDGGGGANTCASNPWSCGAGKTCWAAASVADFQCMAAGTKQKGEACVPVIGQAQCGEAMMCFQNVMAGSAAACAPFCDLGGEHPCAQGETCATVEMLDSPTTVYLCVGGPGPADGGSD